MCKENAVVLQAKKLLASVCAKQRNTDRFLDETCKSVEYIIKNFDEFANRDGKKYVSSSLSDAMEDVRFNLK